VVLRLQDSVFRSEAGLVCHSPPKTIVTFYLTEDRESRPHYKAYRVYNLASGTLEEVHDVEFDKTKGSQDENENFDDGRGIQLSNAMKNMDVDELRPRQVNDEEDDQVQVL
jgi:hypothetical protein